MEWEALKRVLAMFVAMVEKAGRGNAGEVG
jgi:hypothetical protein